MISDFRRILYKREVLTFTEFNKENEKCIDFIRKAVAVSKAKHKIVVTHHVPSFCMQHPKFAGSKANGAFTVELENYIKIAVLNTGYTGIHIIMLTYGLVIQNV